MKSYLLILMATWCFCFGAHGQIWFTSRALPAGKPTAQPALSYDGRFIYWPWAGGIILSSPNWGVNWETNSIATVTNISSIVCSTNGANVALAANNGIYYSSNAGKDWTKTTAPNQPWESVAISADGSKIVAADISETSGIFRSIDSGQTWTQIKSDGTWNWIASSADGSVLLAAASRISDVSVISTNSGATWQPLSQRLYMAALSADGSDIIGIPLSTHKEYVISTNTGASWTTTFEGLAGSYSTVSISADGKTMAAITPYDIKRYDPVLKNWVRDSFNGITSGAMSADGKFIVISYEAAIATWGYQRPIILRNPVTMTVWPRTNLNLTASVVGATPITYRWTFNDQPVGPNNSLLQWTATNSGTFKLTAENAFGTDTVTHTILNVLPIGARMNLLGGADTQWPFGAVVAPGTSDTTVWFEWGVSNSFDHATATTNIPAGPIRSIAMPAPPMQLGVYNVRVIASNSVAVTTSLPARYVPMPVATRFSGFHWFERGYVATNRSLGLPSAGSIFQSESEDASYQMPPDYGAPNAVLVDATSGGTLRLINPAPFSKLSFLTSADVGDVLIRYELRHLDGSTQIGTFTSNDWFDGTNTAFTAHARVNPSTVSPFTFPTTPWRFFIEPNNPRLYGRTITLDNTTSPIVEIGLQRVSGSGHASVFAVSGSTSAAFTPIPVTGFTHDMIIEAEFSGAPAVTFNPTGATFQALPGVQYEITETASLTTPNWKPLSNLTATSRTNVPLPTVDPTQPTRFFHIRPH